MNQEEEEEEILGSDDDEQEAPADYCKGGYHPVKIGDLFHNRYHVIRLVVGGGVTCLKKKNIKLSCSPEFFGLKSPER